MDFSFTSSVFSEWGFLFHVFLLPKGFYLLLLLLLMSLVGYRFPLDKLERRRRRKINMKKKAENDGNFFVLHERKVSSFSFHFLHSHFSLTLYLSSGSCVVLLWGCALALFHSLSFLILKEKANWELLWNVSVVDDTFASKIVQSNVKMTTINGMTDLNFLFFSHRNVTKFHMKFSQLFSLHLLTNFSSLCLTHTEDQTEVKKTD